MRREGIISLNEIPLTESDILNGYEYKGVLTFIYSGPSCEFLFYKSPPEWDIWREGRHTIDIWIVRKSGEWSAKKSGDLSKGATYAEIGCIDVPGYTEKYSQFGTTFFPVFKNIPRDLIVVKTDPEGGVGAWFSYPKAQGMPPGDLSLSPLDLKNAKKNVEVYPIYKEMINFPSRLTLESFDKEIKVEFRKIASREDLARDLLSKVSKLYGHWDFGGCQIYFDEIEPLSVSGNFVLVFPDYDENYPFIKRKKEAFERRVAQKKVELALKHLKEISGIKVKGKYVPVSQRLDGDQVEVYFPPIENDPSTMRPPYRIVFNPFSEVPTLWSHRGFIIFHLRENMATIATAQAEEINILLFYDIPLRFIDARTSPEE